MKPAILADPERRKSAMKPIQSRQLKNQIFVVLCAVTAFCSLLILAVLLFTIFQQGWAHLNWDFIVNPSTHKPDESGVKFALIGTLMVCGLCAFMTLPLGVATAIFLKEFQPRNIWFKRLQGFVELNINNLAGVPSVVYGILALSAFVLMFGLMGTPENPAFEIGADYYYQYFNEGRFGVWVPVKSDNSPAPELTTGMAVETPSGRPIELNVISSDAAWPEDKSLARRTLREGAIGGFERKRHWYHFRLPFGKSILAMSLALMLVVLPILITASQEALRAVPQSLREGAYGLGATRWQTIRYVTLPSAIPGIMTGSIIAMSRAIGEAAPIVIISGTVYMTLMPDSLMRDALVMPLQIYYWAKLPNSEKYTVQFADIAASGIIVLLGVLLVFNAAAVFLRHKLEKPLS
ncbi:MAG: phosphate ABC transporter permease PstA [Planctomycetaceae bacterium]|nr:phosphate ABC transporter permease PstA [Planctomycetaceae bacterium]